MITATPTEQQRLLALQQVDTQLRQQQHRRAHLPEQQTLDEHEEMLSAVSSEYATRRDEMSKLQLTQKRLENEVATLESRRKSEEGRMYSGAITSEKEVEALRHELASLKTRKSDLEDELLEVMERSEEVEGMVSSLKTRHAELQEALPGLTTARDEAAVDIDAELAETKARRDELTAELPQLVLDAYADLLQRKQGLAVAELSGGTCMGCRLQLTASEMEEVRSDAKRHLAICPQCGRGVVPA